MISMSLTILRLLKLSLHTFIKSRAHGKDFELVTRGELVKRLQSKKKKSTCLVLGSSDAALKQLKDYEETCDVYTCNFGVCLSAQPIFTTLELASSSNYSWYIRSLILARRIESLENSAIVLLKGLHGGRIDKEFVKCHYPTTNLIRAIDISIDNSFDLDLVRLASRNRYCPIHIQYFNSITGLVTLAGLVGYDKIVVSGVGGKNHFYQIDAGFIDPELCYILANELLPKKSPALGAVSSQGNDYLSAPWVNVCDKEIQVLKC